MNDLTPHQRDILIAMRVNNSDFKSETYGFTYPEAKRILDWFKAVLK